jgi:deoxyhypusine synthase
LPLLTAYSLSRTPNRPLKRLYDKFPELTRRLENGYAQTRTKRTE